MRTTYLAPLLMLGLGSLALVWADDVKKAEDKKDGDKPAVTAKEDPNGGPRKQDPQPRDNPPRERGIGQRPDGEGFRGNRDPNVPGEGFRAPMRRDGDRPADDRPGEERGRFGPPRTPGFPGGNPGPNGPPMQPGGGFFDPDPEMQELMRKDVELDRQCNELSHRLREATGAMKDEVKTALQKAVEEHFNVRQERRQLQIKKIAEELERLKDDVKARNDSKDAVIRRRLQQLAGEDGTIGF